MNSRILRAACGAAALTLALASPVFAQLDANLGGLTPDNVKGYLEPLPKALSATLNTAAFQSASIPLAGFNLTFGIHAMGVTFADKDNTYIPTDPPGFTHTGGQLPVPTAVGGTTAVLQPGSGGSGRLGALLPGRLRHLSVRDRGAASRRRFRDGDAGGRALDPVRCR